MKNYKKIKVVSEFCDSGLIYEVSKLDKKYYIYEFQQFGEAESYNFKVLKKLMAAHILAVQQQFEEDGVKYIVTDYAQRDLLQLQTSQPSRVFPLPVALDYFSKVILALQELHQNKLVYRNIRPEVIKLRNQDVYFYDFTLSQFCKRKERMFDIVGCQSFLAPEFFSEDGYSFQIDIWAAGVLLFFMLTHEYPFKFKNKTEKACQQELKTTQQGFSFQRKLTETKNPGFLKSNRTLEDFFAKIFAYDYTQRLTIKQIKQHKLMAGFFPEKYDRQFLEAIGQQQSQLNSLLMTRFLDLKQFKISRKVEKEQQILDFIERCSQSLMLDCADYIPEEVRSKAQFAILKVACIKINNLVNFCYGKNQDQFQYDKQEFQIVRSSSAFKKVVQNIERKQKIFHMLFKSAFVVLQNSKSNHDRKDPFYSQQIPDDFNSIKISYRTALAQMFQNVKIVMAKHKTQKALIRKITQLMARMVIMHLINRIFEPEDFNKNFALYIAWNKNDDMENLDTWIHAEKHQNLKQFIKETTKNYL